MFFFWLSVWYKFKERNSFKDGINWKLLCFNCRVVYLDYFYIDEFVREEYNIVRVKMGKGKTIGLF